MFKKKNLPQAEKTEAQHKKKKIFASKKIKKTKEEIAFGQKLIGPIILAVSIVISLLVHWWWK